MITWEQFIDIYSRTGKCLGQLSRPNHKLNDKELKTRYRKYLKAEEKKQKRFEEQIEKAREKQKEEIKIDMELLKIYSEVDQRDSYECQLLAKYPYAFQVIDYVWDGLLQQIDHAHVFGKGSYPELKYDPDNIVLLNRYSHSNIDQYRDPIIGDQITKEEREKWWIKIIGKERYNKLLRKLGRGEIE